MSNQDSYQQGNQWNQDPNQQNPSQQDQQDQWPQQNQQDPYQQGNQGQRGQRDPRDPYQQGNQGQQYQQDPLDVANHLRLQWKEGGSYAGICLGISGRETSCDPLHVSAGEHADIPSAGCELLHGGSAYARRPSGHDHDTHGLTPPSSAVRCGRTATSRWR